jgi:hypothetical protein
MDDLQWSNKKMSESLFLKGIVANAAGDSLTFKRNLKWIAENNSFFTEGVIVASVIAKNNTNDPFATYSILVNALHLNAQSIPILKAYIQESYRIGFEAYANDAEQTLQQVLPEPLFSRFIKSLQ